MSNPNLSQCKDCGGTVSNQAATCPHCGTPNPSGMAGALVIKRQLRVFVGCLVAVEVSLDQSPIGKMKNGETRRWDVAPGEHLLTLCREEIDIRISPNKETIVEFMPSPAARGGVKILSIKNL